MTNLVHDLKDPRRATIVQQARKHFVTHGYTATRMEPVARGSGVSTATLYGFFESKTALFEAVINAATDEIAAQLESLPRGDGSSRDQLDTLMAFYAEFLNNGDAQAVFRLVLAERHRFAEVTARFFERGRNYFADHLIKLINKMSSSGQLKVEDASVAGGQLMGMIEHVIFFTPLIEDQNTPDNEAIDPQTASHAAKEAVVTFLARYGA